MRAGDDKSAIRASLIAGRRALDPEDAASMSRRAAEEALRLPQLAGARAVHLYLPIGGMREADTAPLAEGLSALGIRICVPLIVGDGIVSVAYRPGMDFKASRFGSPEPTGTSVPADESLVDAVVLPLVGVDRSGNRLGYGKGFYDRFLSRLRAQGLSPWRIGLGFSMQLCPDIPGDPWDQPLDFFVSEEGVMRFHSSTDHCNRHD